MPQTRLIVALIAAAPLALAALAAAGCNAGAFDMGEMHDRMHRPGDPAPQTPVVADATSITVEIRDYDFSPRDLTIRVGTQVTWSNLDSAPHDATSGGVWGTGLLRENESASISFDEPGVYEYICTVHPYMTGTLTVQQEA